MSLQPCLLWCRIRLTGGLRPSQEPPLTHGDDRGDAIRPSGGCPAAVDPDRTAIWPVSGSPGPSYMVGAVTKTLPLRRAPPEHTTHRHSLRSTG